MWLLQSIPILLSHFTKRTFFPNIVINVICLFSCVLVSAPAALPFIIMTIMYKPYQRGIYCDDESIMYPVKPDTITHGMLAAVTISCTVIIVSFTLWRHTAVIPLESFDCLFLDLLWRGLSGLQQEDLLKFRLQPVCSCTLQGSGHLFVWSSCQPVFD